MSTTTTNEAAAKDTSFRLPVWGWLTLWMGVWVGAPVAIHYGLHGVVNGWHVTLVFFLAINMLVCIWEISLWHRIGDIERWFGMPRATGDRPRGSLYTLRVRADELFSTRLWARVWLEYSYWDDGYANPESFGFTIDVGNGFSTLVPSLLFLVGMTFPILSPVVLGVIGLLIFYQKLYCTCLYFFQYFFNRRFEGRPTSGIVSVVGGSNGVWLLFPAIGIYVCLRLILDDRFALIRS